MDLPQGYTHIPLDKVGSTNDEAHAYLQAGAATDRTVITAAEQARGRGRSGRTWISAEGNLYATLVLMPLRAFPEWPQLSFVLSLALAEALEAILPRHRHVELKWPNDVLVDGKKISGVLLETTEGPEGKAALLAGVGVNCRSCPFETLYPATCLKDEGAKVLDITPQGVLTLFLQKFEPLYQNWQALGLANIRPAWLSRAKSHGQAISIRVSDYLDGGGRLHGLFMDIEEETGALVLKQDDGSLHRITQGDVFFPDMKREAV